MKNDTKGADLTLTHGDFNATTIKVEASSDAGRAFLGRKLGHGAIGCEIFVSSLEAFTLSAMSDAMTIRTLLPSGGSVFTGRRDGLMCSWSE